MNDLTEMTATTIVDCAVKVHRKLGPGLLESIYETCLIHELNKSGSSVRSQVILPVRYDGFELDAGMRLDLIVDERVIVEVKAVEHLLPLHTAQLLTYLKLSGVRFGLLANFNSPLMRDGLRRLAL